MKIEGDAAAGKNKNARASRQSRAEIIVKHLNQKQQTLA
jgi:hypothetical protein